MSGSVWARWYRGRSIRTRFAVVYTAVLILALIGVTTAAVFMTQNLMFRAKKTALQTQAQVISNTLPVTERLTAEGVAQAMNLLDDVRLTRILITDEAGLTLYDTGAEPMDGRYALVQEIVSALRGNDVFSCEYRNGVFRSWAVTPVMLRGRVAGAVYVYESDSEQGQLLRQIHNNLQGISMLVCLAMLLVSWLLSTVLTRRIGELLAAIRVVRAGEYDHRVRLAGQDELSQMAEEFNQMTERLKATEEIRRRFVSDASHELKTPLASIRLLTDSILQDDSMDRETALDFVTDIGTSADRLIRISEQLLLLNRLDAGQKPPSLLIDLSALTARNCHLLLPLARAADITFRVEIEPGCVVRANENDLNQIVSNLMENAIKYNFPRGTVTVRLWQDDAVIFQVEDSGVGIPEEDMPRIFDRFYRVDKARSREAGGTGLGLSIVWEAVHTHGGEIHASAASPSGTCFTVMLPYGEDAE